MRRLYRRLAFLYFVSALLFVLIFGILLYLRGRKENEEYLSQLLESVDHNLEEATRESVSYTHLSPEQKRFQ